MILKGVCRLRPQSLQVLENGIRVYDPDGLHDFEFLVQGVELDRHDLDRLDDGAVALGRKPDGG